MKTTWPVVWVLALAAMPSAQTLCTEGPPTTLGSVTVLFTGVPGLQPIPRTTNDGLQIDCAGLPTVQAHVQISEPPPGVPFLGTLLLANGGAGQALYSSESGGLPVLLALQAHGFRVVDHAMTPGWFSDPLSVRKQSCRFATLLAWVHDRYHTEGMFAALGTSSGAGVLGYALSTWNAERYLDLAVFSGGPPMARYDLMCPQPPPASWPAQCAQLFPPFVIECGQPSCSAQSGIFGPALCIKCSPNPTPREHLEESILHPAADTHYPNTRVHLLFGAQDCTGSVTSGLLFYNAVTGEKLYDFVPATPHSLVLTQLGREAIERTVLAGAASFGAPVAVDVPVWPSGGGPLDLHLRGRAGAPYAAVAALNQSTMTLPPFGWLFLAPPWAPIAGGVLDAAGRSVVSLPGSPLTPLIGIDVYVQALVGTILSNGVHVRVQP